MTVTEEQSRKVSDLVDLYDGAIEDVKRTQEAYFKAQKRLTNAKHDLAILLVPPDAKCSETFHLWLRRRVGDGTTRDALLCVTTPASEHESDFHVEWREG